MISYTELLCSGIKLLNIIKCDNSVNFHSYSPAPMSKSARSSFVPASLSVKFDNGVSSLSTSVGYELFYQHLPSLLFVGWHVLLGNVLWLCAGCWLWLFQQSLQGNFVPTFYLLSLLNCHVSNSSSISYMLLASWLLCNCKNSLKVRFLSSHTASLTHIFLVKTTERRKSIG